MAFPSIIGAQTGTDPLPPARKAPEKSILPAAIEKANRANARHYGHMEIDLQTERRKK